MVYTRTEVVKCIFSAPAVDNIIYSKTPSVVYLTRPTQFVEKALLIMLFYIRSRVGENHGIHNACVYYC